MKNFTLLFSALFYFLATSVNAQSYSQSSVNTSFNGIKAERTTYVMPNNRQPVLETYTDRTLFQNDYILQSGEALTSEDFSSGPSGINTCGTVISANGDDCFLPGELVAGFSITSTNDAGGGDVVSISVSEIGNAIHLVGANTFPESTIVNFSVDVYAVGMDIWNNSDTQTSFRVYNALGDLIEVYPLINTVGAENFFGIIANEPISRVEIEEANGGGDLIGQLEFGEFVLNTHEFTENQVVIYPNPVSSRLYINTVSSVEVEKVSLYTILGKDTGLRFINNGIDTSRLASGVYLLTIETSKGIVSKKIIKE